MNTDAKFLHLGKHIVSLSQIVSARQIAPKKATTRHVEGREFSGWTEVPVPATPFMVELTLTSVELDRAEAGETGLAAASTSVVITVSGVLAEKLWSYLESQSEVIDLTATYQVAP